MVCLFVEKVRSAETAHTRVTAKAEAVYVELKNAKYREALPWGWSGFGSSNRSSARHSSSAGGTQPQAMAAPQCGPEGTAIHVSQDRDLSALQNSR